MSKVEKILTTLVVWLYAGFLLGLFLAFLTGGYTGMFILIIGTMLGGVTGFLRSIFFFFKYEKPSSETASKLQIILRRIIIAVLYFFIYAVIVSYLKGA